MRLLDSDCGMILIDESERLGQGGRGAVFPLVGNEDLVCKLMSDGYCSPGRRRKIEHLSRVGAKSGAPAAWPLDNVFDEGAWAGYTMRRIRGVTLDAVCANDDTTLEQRARLAAKACGIVERMHERGIVVGDVNMANFMYDVVSDELSLIDLDSVQVVDHERKEVYPVVESLEKSPEMLENELGKVALTVASDNFLVAVMVFRMLFGAHPLDSFEPDSVPSEVRARNARERRFPYRKLHNSLPASAFGVQLESLFVSSFTGPAAAVPTAARYRGALENLAAHGFAECPSCRAQYARDLISCPACERGATSGRVNPRFAALVVAGAVTFSVFGPDVAAFAAEAVEGAADLLGNLTGGFAELLEAPAQLARSIDEAIAPLGEAIEALLG